MNYGPCMGKLEKRYNGFLDIRSLWIFITLAQFSFGSGMAATSLSSPQPIPMLFSFLSPPTALMML